MDKYTTADCKKLIKEWYEKNNEMYPDDLKRVRKYKDSKGQFVRLFESDETGETIKVIENAQGLKINDMPGHDHLFAFIKTPDMVEASKRANQVWFAVVEQKFFAENHFLDSVHFTDNNKMPECFGEEMESIFSTEGMTRDEVRVQLLALGFVESQEVEEMMNDSWNN